ncbi:hypothetical protein WR25_15006 [Diploscapter pachys]|uniref:Protein kinase domain-containing protein n=1 Tax=Diploscapter pachys TaxID=2018661 RepID=A0A2A2JRX5_9BILA|nr:hypothetical protein WR25_15006 [Diploscapter pachys]
MIRKTNAEDPAKQQQHLEQAKEKDKENEKQVTPQKGATITCITKEEKDEKEDSRKKPKKNEEVAKKKTLTDRKIKMFEVKGAVANEPKKSDEKEKQKSPEGRRRRERKKSKMRREKLRNGMAIRSEAFSWKVISRLGSGGFGDVYRVRKERSKEGKEEAMDYAMKTEMVMGEKRLLRLKIEVMVLEAIREQLKEDRRTHFVELIDKGKTGTYKA